MAIDIRFYGSRDPMMFRQDNGGLVEGSEKPVNAYAQRE
jgi:hypothetical protein